MTPQLIQLKSLPNVALVRMPEGVPIPDVINTGQPHLSWLDIDIDLPDINLPPGNWRIIGVLSEVTEEQIADIVDSVSVTCTDGTEYGGWRNYVYRDDFDEDILLNTALESLESAILAEGYYLDENPIPEPDISRYPNDDWIADYNNAQSRVLYRKRCLVLRSQD